MIGFVPDIDKKYILEHVSEEEIYQRYFRLEVSFKGKFCSPLRDDKNPTCNFFRHNRSGEIYMKDHAGHFCGNCFDALMVFYGCTFKKALLMIANDFGLIKIDVERKPVPLELRERQKADIKFSTRAWLKSDDEFWSKYCINHQLLKYFKVFPVQTIFLNNGLCYTYHVGNPAYAYVFGENDIKIYFPKRKESRFICNTSKLQGYDQLPEKGEILIVTKSMKDVMVLFNLGYSAVAPQSETQMITQEEYDELSKRFEKIYSFYDFDLTGIRTANKMKKIYGIPTIFLTNGRFGTTNFRAKDVSDKLELIIRSETEMGEIKREIQLSKVFLTKTKKSCFKPPLVGRKDQNPNSHINWRDCGNKNYLGDVDTSAPF